jgi:predicted RNA binding protein YcfA (HicA-like mRNA interferase family)
MSLSEEISGMKASGHSPSEIIEILREDGWVPFNVEGSHHSFKHPVKKGKVTLKHPDKDVPPKTFKSIMKQAGL